MRGAPRHLVWLALGGNITGSWGSPPDTFARSLRELESHGVEIIATSPVFVSTPLGSVRQPRFHNAVIAIRSPLTAFALLLALKRIERRAGRRNVLRWGPRPLDIDILDFAGAVVRVGERRTRRNLLVLPHPEMHRRGFVMLPLAMVAPTWRHPVIGIRAKDALKRAPGLRRGLTLQGSLA